MTQTAHTGPIISFGQGSAPTDYNADAGPSLFYSGGGLLDPRPPFTYKSSTRFNGGNTYGFYGFTDIPTIQAVPSALAANNIAASQTPVAGTALTLVSSSGAGITVGQSITRSDTGATVTGLLVTDGASSYVTFGQGGTGTGGIIRLWNPATLIARAVRIVSAGNDSGATFVIKGYDIYYYPMQETITGANAGTATGLKAFKYIASITPAGTLSGSAVTVGTTDVIGLPLRADYVSETAINMASTWITASTGFTAAVTTSPATATTGDVRGTYTLQTASDGSRRLAIFQTPLVTNIGSTYGTTTGLFGVTQYATF